MSINDALRQLEIDGKVVRFQAPRGFAAKRGLFLTEDLVKALNGTNGTVAFYKAKMPIISLFERWVKGDLVKVRLRGHKRGAFVARLEPPPPDVWEFRVTEPTPQFRVFFRFVSKDIAVATSIRTRAELGPKQTKSGKKSHAWASVMRECGDHWGKLFGSAEPLSGDDLSQFMTEYEHVE